MSLLDEHGNPYSTGNRDALASWERAVALYQTYNDDPLPLVNAALEADPDFVMGHCFHAATNLSGTDKAGLVEVRKRMERLGDLAPKANDRERGHIAAIVAWAGGDWKKAAACWGAVLESFPRDAFALHLVHSLDFFLGDPRILRDRIARVLPHWDASVPGHGYVVGMHAFGLEEAGDYPRAEERGMYAVEQDPRDAWAVHAVAHVYEMEGRLEDGVAWLDRTWGDWSDGVFAVHNAWHKALLHVDMGQHEVALHIYDEMLFRPDNDFVQELLDAASLLWRLDLAGTDTGERWQVLAPCWRRRTGDGNYAFNDMHTMMAMIATGDELGQADLLKTMEAVAQTEGTNAMMTRRVGLPVCRGLQAFGRRRFDDAVRHLAPVRYDTHLFGGSHAQRDVIALTLMEAALASEDLTLARTLAAERWALKPSSPANRRFLSRAGLAQ